MWYINYSSFHMYSVKETRYAIYKAPKDMRNCVRNMIAKYCIPILMITLKLIFNPNIVGVIFGYGVLLFMIISFLLLIFKLYLPYVVLQALAQLCGVVIGIDILAGSF